MWIGSVTTREGFASQTSECRSGDALVSWTPAYDDRRVRMQKASMDTVTVETNLDFLLA
jgi:hypothetical protein